MMSSILPTFTSVWHTLRDTGKTCHSIRGRILHNGDIQFPRLQGCSYGRSVHCQAPMTAQRRSEQHITGEKHSFLASEDTSFSSLGLQNAVIEALHLAGYSRPSRVQVHESPQRTYCKRHINTPQLCHGTIGILWSRLTCLPVPRSCQLNRSYLDGLLCSLLRLAAGKL